MSSTRPVLQPQVVPAPPRHHGGLTPEVMLFAMLLVLPALWHSIIERDLPLVVVLERYALLSVPSAEADRVVQALSETTVRRRKLIAERVGG